MAENDYLPTPFSERDTSLPRNVKLVGHTADELRYGLDLIHSDLGPGDRVEVSIVSRQTPTEEELGKFHVGAAAMGRPLARYPETDIVDGLSVTTFVLKGVPETHGMTGVVPVALIALIPTALIIGLIAFGITRIGDVSKALIPLLLITIGGVVILAGILTRKPVVEAAGRYAERYRPKTKLKYLTNTQTVKTSSAHLLKEGDWFRLSPGGEVFTALGQSLKFTTFKDKSGKHDAIPSNTSVYPVEGMAAEIDHIGKGLQGSMSEEKEAAAIYRARGTFADEVGDNKTASLYQHLAGEEEQHYQELKQRKDERQLEFLGDSAEFLTQTIDMTGMRQKLDNAFITRMARCRS